MPFYFRTILVIANDVKYFNNLSIMLLCLNFLLSSADWTTLLGTTQIAGFSNFAKQTNKHTNLNTQILPFFIFAGLRFKPDVETISNLYI